MNRIRRQCHSVCDLVSLSDRGPGLSAGAREIAGGGDVSGTNLIDKPRLGERVEVATTASGVRVALARKPGFSTAAGYFGVRFGSNDTHFEFPDGRIQRVPDGSAHFLEHKLFEGRNEKVFDRFGRVVRDVASAQGNHHSGAPGGGVVEIAVGIEVAQQRGAAGIGRCPE